jgi:Domain of Unknown Function (DUF1206)
MKGFRAIEWLARVGFLVKGVLCMVIGALALQVAAKAGGRVTGTRGALTTVLGQPFGRTLLPGSLRGFSATPPGASFKDSSIRTAWTTIGVAWRSVRASWLAGSCTRCWGGRHSASIPGCRPHREPASGKSPPRHSGGCSVIGWSCSRGSASSAWPCSRCTRRSPADWSAISMWKRCDARLASGRQPVRRGGTRRCLCAVRMGNRRCRLGSRSVGSRHHDLVIPHARCTTGRAGPSSRRRR